MAIALNKSPREVLESHTSKELAEWMAYSRIEPIGAKREDYRYAMLMAHMANLWSSKDKTYKPEEFLPKFTPNKEEKQDWKQQKRIAEMFNAAFGGKVIQ